MSFSLPGNRKYVNRRVLLTSAAALLVLGALLGATSASRTPRAPLRRGLAVADSDTVQLAQPLPAADSDSTRLAQPLPADSDSTSAAPVDSFRLTRRYLKPLWGRGTAQLDSLAGQPASVLAPQPLPLMPKRGSYWNHETTMDSTSRFYTVRERVADQEVRGALRLNANDYRRRRLQAGVRTNWQDLVQQHEQQRARASGRGGLGVNIDVPGGRTSAFSTIFGKPQVDLRVNGEAQVKAGFNYRYSDQQATFTGSAGQLDPTFKQDLRLGIAGTIGDKLKVNVDWDTQSQFEYQNQIKLDYTGHEDDILQNVEAGNVLLRSPSTLINGGQKLFGIKSEFQLGGVHLTTVASQQEGQSNTLSLEGGAQEQEFELGPTDYDDRKHFFLSYFFRNSWETTLSKPPVLQLQQNFDKIVDVEVWRLQQRNQQDETRSVVAMIDLGEQGQEGQGASGVPILAQNPRTYTAAVLPNPNRDQYSSQELNEKVRYGTANPKAYLKQKGLGEADYQVGTSFTLLQESKDYEVDDDLGYISLNQRLKDNQALAVAYRYSRTNGPDVKVGDFLSDAGGSTGARDEDNLVLKLIRPTNLRPPSGENGEDAPAAWFLEMRNIYNISGGGINTQNFDLDIFYEPSGSTQENTLPDLGTQELLLQQLGLDRLNSNQQRKPDSEFDYLRDFTIDRDNGLIIFPYLEPFGQRLAKVIRKEGGGQKLLDKYVYDDLYLEKKELARQNKDQNVYTIEGSYKGAQPSFYDLKAYAGLVEGSVTVTSGGTKLQEGSDYVVDYQGGTVTITDQQFLAAGRNISIDYEQNKLFNIQKKTLLGARADYSLGEKFTLGATAMRLTQRSPVDKYRIGEEPVSNTILGLDGSLELEPRWLTWAVDALPLVQTKAPSAVSLSGEIANLRPGHSQTLAFERSRRELQDKNFDFKSDELKGISYLDDFEGFENTFSISTPGSWRLSSAPLAIHDDHASKPLDPPGLEDDRRRSTWRASMGWYTLNQNIREQLKEKGSPLTPALTLPPTRSVFPNKPCRQNPCRITPFDVYFNPHRRGPYNYVRDLQNFLDHPERTWGGITLSLPEGYNDFNLKNIEFVEFVFKPYYEDGQPGAASDPRLVLNLGAISEDVIPNQEENNEDGLSINQLSENNLDDNGLSRLPNSNPDGGLDISESSPKRTEDLGLDGLASYDGSKQNYITPKGTELTEQAVYEPILQAMAASCTTDRCRRAVQRARQDPSNDDYHNYASDFYDKGTRAQERFLHYFAGQEINGYESQDEVGSGDRGNARYPDGENLKRGSAFDTDNSYFQYELPIAPDRLDALAANDDPNDYVINKIQGAGDEASSGWYLIRIPVKKITDNIGDKQDYSLVQSLRLWTTGHKDPVTMRFATMELVGSQWRTSDKVSWYAGAGLPPFPTPPGAEETRLSISSVNNEENGGSYAIPFGTVRKRTSRSAAGGGRSQAAREQSLVMRVENLRSQQQRAIFKTYNQGVNFLKYGNIRMFTHMHGRRGGQLLRRIPKKARKHIKLFMRLGTNQATDYYEYEQPLTPSEPKVKKSSDKKITPEERNDLWQTNQPYDGKDLDCPDRPSQIDLNSLNIEISALNQLKFARDTRGAPRDSLFWSDQRNADGKPLVPTCFAPPGTRLAVKGNPSLGEIQTIVVGVKYEAGAKSLPLRNLEVWLNELRVSDYDQSVGWAGLANANIKLADFATVRGNFRRRTSGFGSLNSTLGDRRQIDRFNWTFGSQVYLDKLLPASYGLRIPFSFQLSSKTSTPEFAPSRGDIRVTSIMNQLHDPEAKTEALRAAQTHNVSRSMSVNFSKSGSESFWLRNTLDGLSVSYSLSDRNSRSPTQQRNDRWHWNTSIDYSLNAQPHTISPFSFLDQVPLLGILGDLALNYVPSSVTLRGSAQRNFSASKNRPQPNAPPSTLPPSVRYQLRDKQEFRHKRSAGLQYSPFEFLNVSFDTDTNQSLSPISVDTAYSVVVTDSSGRPTKVYENTRMDELNTDTLAARGLNAYQRDSLDVTSTADVLSRLYHDPSDVHTKNHGQRFNTTLSLDFLRDVEWLDWIQPQDLSYNAKYGWNNGAIGSNSGASVSVTSSFKSGIEIEPLSLLRKFDFYTHLEEDQKQAETETGNEDQRNKPAPAKRRSRGQKSPADTTGRQAGHPGAASDSLSGGGLHLASYLPDPIGLLRGTFLAATSIENITFNYSASRSSRANHVGRTHYGSKGEVKSVSESYGLWDAFQGDAPPLGYRFGVNRQLDPSTGFRVLGSDLRVQDRLTSGNQINANSTLSPSDNLQINLNWNTEWNQSSETTFNLNLDNENCSFKNSEIQRAVQSGACINGVPDRGGTNTTSTWSLGSSYRSLFKRQLDALQGDFQPDAQLISDSTGNGDGRTVLTKESVLNDFRRVYANGFGAVDSRGLLPFPLPSWQITYSGLSEWPLISSLVERASLKHGYRSTYKSDYGSASSLGETATFQFAGRDVQYHPLSFGVNSLNVNEQFNPLIGLDISWNGNLQTGISWSQSKVHSISTGNMTVGETSQNKVSLNASYQQKGLNIPFLPIESLSNTVRFSLSASYSRNDDRRYYMERALQQAAEDDPLQYDASQALVVGQNRQQLARSSRISVTPRISYTISNRVSADLTMTYKKLSSDKDRVPSSTTIDGGVNIRVSIAN